MYSPAIDQGSLKLWIGYKLVTEIPLRQCDPKSGPNPRRAFLHHDMTAVVLFNDAFAQ